MQIKEYLAILRRVETEVASIDEYVDLCLKKYGPFVFNIKQFMGDELFCKVVFVERYKVETGQYKGYIYWGQLLESEDSFDDSF